MADLSTRIENKPLVIAQKLDYSCLGQKGWENLSSTYQQAVIAGISEWNRDDLSIMTNLSRSGYHTIAVGIGDTGNFYIGVNTDYGKSSSIKGRACAEPAVVALAEEAGDILVGLVVVAGQNGKPQEGFKPDEKNCPDMCAHCRSVIAQSTSAELPVFLVPAFAGMPYEPNPNLIFRTTPAESLP